MRRWTARWFGAAAALLLVGTALTGVGLRAGTALAAGTGSGIVSAAAAEAGATYCWDGGTTAGPTHGDGNDGSEANDCGSPSTVGFDCSGLALYAVYQATGIVLPHNAAEQATEYASYGGTLVPSQLDLEPGDLVFFGGSSMSTASHVGIYAGGGMMWDANTAWGSYPDGVHERSMAATESGSGGLRYDGAVRYWTSSGSRGAVTSGEFVSEAGQSEVYVIAGGAPLYVSTWSAVGGSHPVVTVDPAAVANAGGLAPWNHLNARPSDGTLIADQATGMVYEMAGGAPLYVSSWADIGGARPVVTVDDWDLENTANPAAHLSTYPANGTMLRNYTTGAIYRVADGYPFYLVSCAPIGGCPSYTNIDGWDIANRSDPNAHLREHVTNGTTVEAMPSGHYWKFESGLRTRTGASNSAVQVDDTSVTGFETPVAVTTGSLPAGHKGHQLDDRVRAAGGKSPYRWSRADGSLPPGVKLSVRGTISGKPTRTGSWTFTVRVTDSTTGHHLTASRQLTLEVDALHRSSVTKGR